MPTAVIYLGNPGLYGRMRRGIGPILRDLCRPKEIELVEGKAMPDHVPMLLSVPPRSSIAMSIGYLKGTSATRIHRELLPILSGILSL